MDEIEAELQYKRNFPSTFLEAFDMLMKRIGDTREAIAEKLSMPSRTLLRWLEDPDRRINADFVVTVALLCVCRIGSARSCWTGRTST